MKRQMMVLGLMVIMGLTVLASETVVTIVSAFPGNYDPGWKPTIDASGAVGPKHVVDFDTGGFVVHDKATWKELQRFSQREFWNKVEQADSIDPKSYANDMRMLCDPLTER